VIRRPKPSQRRRPRTPLRLDGLEIEAKGIDPESIVPKRRVPRYDVMATHSDSQTGLPVQTQEERQSERAQILRDLADDARERRRAYEHLEAPLKKIREKSRFASEDGLLYLAVQSAKPPPFGAIKLRQMSEVDRTKEIELLCDLIREKRKEVQRRRESDAAKSDDFIAIGSTDPHSGPGPLHAEYEQVSSADDTDMIEMTAIAKSVFDFPPTEFPAGVGEVSPSIDTGLFLFTGLPLDIPGMKACGSIEDRLDCLQQFLEQGLGADMAERAKNCVRGIVAGSIGNEQFGQVFSNQGVLVYFPFVQHLVFCEQFGKPPEDTGPANSLR
jgi:hypothetical protein